MTSDHYESGDVGPVDVLTGETALAPDRESDDYAVLAAWYSGFAYAEHYRKVVQAQCWPGVGVLHRAHAGYQLAVLVDDSQLPPT